MYYKELFKQLFKQYKTSIIFGASGLVLLIIAVAISFSASKMGPANSFEIVKEGDSSASSESLKSIVVDIEGAVAKPGIYEMRETERISDALNAAGGILESADSEFVTKTLNKAQTLTDGMKIYIPFKGETQGVFERSSGSLININTASSSRLESLTGIGEKTAKKIIDGRPYSDTSDLVTKKIVSKSVFEKIKDQISVY